MRTNKERKPMDYHGFSNTQLYHRWTGIVSRVTDPNNACYRTYGGRGITICDEWRDFLRFQDWALSSSYQKDLVIDRINVDGNYCPENCRWVTKSESSINRRKGRTFDIQKNYRRFQVTIVRHNFHYYLGTFATNNEALMARDNFLKEYENGLLLTYKSKKKYVA